MRDRPATEGHDGHITTRKDSTMIGNMLAVLLLVGGYGFIAVLSARAVLRDELTRRRRRTGVLGTPHDRAVLGTAHGGSFHHLG
jgi:hypothetical protein